MCVCVCVCVCVCTCVCVCVCVYVFVCVVRGSGADAVATCASLVSFAVAAGGPGDAHVVARARRAPSFKSQLNGLSFECAGL